jgi:hypothetical protein
LDIQKFENGFKKINSLNIQMLDDNYFLNGNIKTLNDQRKKFDQDVLKFVQKSNSVSKKPPSLPKEPKKPPSSSKLKSEILLEKIQNKRRAFNKILFAKENEVYETQLKFLEHEHQLKQNGKAMETIFESPVPLNQISKNEALLDQNFNEAEYFSNLKDFYMQNNYDDIRNINQEDIIKIRDFVKEKTKTILKEAIIPEEYPSFGDQNGIKISYMINNNI